MMLSDKQKALVYHLMQEESFDPKEAVEAVRDNTEEDDIDRVEVGVNDAGPRDYTVFTDSEADAAWDDYLESYIDDCLEIPDHLENYFDREAFKSDARVDGRGHSLSSWDGNEFEYKVNGEWFYVYKN